ncbi:hypothetical protein [Brevibacillus formosus]|uniref:hypothetical protein n=1 Tax=Brevibacillus formosus TaxID=54913 RepID=UPI001F26E873|nr:hypothetical protein [Brevibacillus formosus]
MHKRVGDYQSDAENKVPGKEGIVTHTYKLYPRLGLARKKQYNHAIIGASIQGRVLQVQKDNVRAKPDMDDQQDQSTAYWFGFRSG